MRHLRGVLFGLDPWIQRFIIVGFIEAINFSLDWVLVVMW
jgi:hypothetical protein